MEASLVLRRSLRTVLSPPKTCQCRSPQRTIKLPLRSNAASHRPLSSSARRRQEDTQPPPESNLRSSSAPPPSPETSKQRLQRGISSIQKIIDGYKLKDVIPSRQYETLVVALTNAEVRLDAPGVNADSFAPVFESLRNKVDPILKYHLGTATLRNLVADIGIHKSYAIPQPNTPKASISKLLDETIGPKPAATTRQSQPTTSDPPSSDTSSDMVYNLYEFFREGAAKTDETQTERQRSLNVQERLAASDTQYQRLTQLRNLQYGDTSTAPLRLKPSLGRMIEVTGAFDVTRALRAMESLCARNSVKQDTITQRFHVRRGQKKKILKMTRWRKLFIEGFLKECERVRRMKKQGW